MCNTIIAILAAIEESKEPYFQPNPRGRFAICKPTFPPHVPGHVPTCARCGNPIDRTDGQGGPPCSHFPPEQRFVEDYHA